MTTRNGTRTDLYATVTDSLVRALEHADGSAWRAPWHSTTLTLPANATTHKHYRGVNVAILWAAQYEHGYASGVWATFKQWHELDARVRKGEHGTRILLWKPVDRGDGAELDDGQDRRYLLARSFVVFNADQVDDFELPKLERVPLELTCERARAFFDGLGADIRHGGDSAYYAPAIDLIQLPDVDAFRSEVDYWATSAHEHVHWTAPAHRADRADALGNRFGDAAYALEELVAELGAAYACAWLGLSNEPRQDHARYLASWVRLLRDDRSAFVTAASKAQAAFDWMATHSRELVAA